MYTQEFDVLVIGAGPSGIMAASMVNKSGLKVKVVEKTCFPRFVIGESLLAKCMDNFKEAGVLEEISKLDFQVKNGAVFFRDNESCDFDFSEQFTKGYKSTWQVQRDKFDKVVADKVASMGVDIEYELEVVDVRFNESDSVVFLKDKQGDQRKINTRYIIDASGFGMVLPKLLDLECESRQINRSTIFTHFQDPNRPTHHSNKITVISHQNDIWIWVIPFSDGTSSCGFVGNPEFFNKYKGDASEKLRLMIQDVPLLKQRFHNSKMIFEAKEIYAYSKYVKKLYGKGYVLTGNAMGFLDPIFSSGLTMATESGILAGKLVSEEINIGCVDWEEDYSLPMSHGFDVFSTYINAWYDGSLHKIFFSKQVNKYIKKQICSVLAGYVWDKSNPFVMRYESSLYNLSMYLD